MKTYEQLQEEFLDERAFSPKGQAARAKMRVQNAKNLANKINPRTGSPMKALPPGRSSAPKTPTQAAVDSKPSRGGDLAVRPADKGSSIVRSKVQDNKDRESAKKDAKQKLNSGSAGNPILGKRKKDQRPNAAGVDTQRRRQTELERRRKQKEHDSKAGDRLAKRQGGIGGGIKKALGGDVVGVRAKAGESEADKELRKKTNSKNRADFAQKKVGQAGNLAKGALGAVANAAKNSSQTKDLNPVDTKITAPQRGLYNPK